MSNHVGAAIALLLISSAMLTHGADVDEPVFYLDFNELTNNTIVSRAAVPLVGTVNGPVFEPAGHLDGAYTFDGIDDQVVFGPSPVFDLTDLTMSAWVKSVDYNEFAQAVIDSATFSLASGGYTLAVTENELRMAIRYQDGSFHQFRALDTFSASDNNQWKFVVGTLEYDGANSTGKLYLDGDLVFSETVATAAPTYDSQSLFIGDNYDVGFKREFHGDIDEIRLYDCVLDQSAIDGLRLAGQLKILNAVELAWFAEAGRTYQLQRADLGSSMVWTNEGNVVTGEDAVVSFFRSGADAQAMYRITGGP